MRDRLLRARPLTMEAPPMAPAAPERGLVKTGLDTPLKDCQTKCEKYHGLPLAFSSFDEITKRLDIDFNITSYYVDAEYNFEDSLTTLGQRKINSSFRAGCRNGTKHLPAKSGGHNFPVSWR